MSAETRLMLKEYRDWPAVQTQLHDERVAVSTPFQRDGILSCPLFLKPALHTRVPGGPVVPPLAGHVTGWQRARVLRWPLRAERRIKVEVASLPPGA